ncbi:MAG TPA: hypothetical protein VKW08_22130 [Xanthobacteraceae bacterium]|nr:hypothetical protein [Xanthobacteraceae bacterium]
MRTQRDFLLFAAVTAVALSAATLIVPSVVLADGESKSGGASIPDFSHVWTHPAFPWYEPPASGPGPITNLSRWAEQRPGGSAGSAALPPGKVGISDYDQLVGDYTSPILQPWAAAVVKRYGELSLAGITFPNPSNQCWPFPMPFIFKQSTIQMIQQADRITLLYSGDHEVRRIRLNEAHPSPLTPSWYGDSVGHYDGDTLVVDTVGVKTDRPYAMIDLFGTPYTDKLHVVERYRLRGYDEVKDALERNKKENWLFGGDVFSRHRGKFLQLHLTVEDEGVFTTPWTATLTYVPGGEEVGEGVCAENPHEYYNNKDADVPKADKPDF